jgi:hypothetical protein
MSSRVPYLSLLFAAGIGALEGTSSVVHALVVKDVPPELAAQGIGLGWMLSRDLLLSALGGAAFALGLWARSVNRDEPARGLACFALGFAFAAALEILNWIIPNALLAPSSLAQGAIAWTYFVGGPVLAARLVTRRDASRAG